MGFLLFVIIIGIVIAVAVRSKSPESDDQYGRGYWDGYRAFGEKLQDEMAQPKLDREVLQSLIDQGKYGVVESSPTREFPVYDTEAVLHDESTDTTSEAQEIAPIEERAVAAPPLDESIQKEQRSIRNLNILLYMASFLLIAAGVAFIATDIADIVKLIGVWLIVIVFYGVGMGLYAGSERLRPAGMAFLGTGLALVPFAGLALYSYTEIGSVAAWALTSVIGLIAYSVAAIKLQSQLVSYLTMAFVLSLAAAAGATVSTFIIWQLALLIIVSIGAGLLGSIKPQWVAEVFREPIKQTGQFVTPLVLIASLFVYSQMNIVSYQVLFALATLHYIVAWLQTRSLEYEAAIRALGHVTLLLVGWGVLSDHIVTFGGYAFILASLQQVYSLLRVKQTTLRRRVEQWWICCLFGLQLGAVLFWQSDAHSSLLTVFALLLIGLTGLTAALRLRDARYGYVGLASLVFVTLITTRQVLDPVWSYAAIAILFMCMAWVMHMLYYRLRTRSTSLRLFVMISAMILLGLSLLLTLMSSNLGYIAGIFGVATLHMLLASYLWRQVYAQLAASIMTLIALTALSWMINLEAAWRPLFIGGAGATLHMIMLFVQSHDQQYNRAFLAFAVAQMSIGVTIIGGIWQQTLVTQLTCGLLLVAAMITILIRRQARLFGTEKNNARRLAVVAYPIFTVIALLLSLGLSGTEGVGVLLICAGIAWVASYIEEKPFVVALGNALLVVAGLRIWSLFGLDSTWAIIGISWITAMLFYGLYWTLHSRRDTQRADILLVSTGVVLAFAIVTQFFPLPIAAAMTLIAGAGIMAVEGYRRQMYGIIEAAVYLATLGVQRVLGVLLPELNIVFYAHYWAITIVLAGFLRSAVTQQRIIIAMAMVTGSTALYALGSGGGYALLFLVEHVGLLVFGAMRQQSWALWWGLSAASLAILYFLRDIVFLAFGFLGLLIIGFVIWRLMKTQKSK